MDKLDRRDPLLGDDKGETLRKFNNGSLLLVSEQWKFLDSVLASANSDRSLLMGETLLLVALIKGFAEVRELQDDLTRTPNREKRNALRRFLMEKGAYLIVRLGSSGHSGLRKIFLPEEYEEIRSSAYGQMNL